MTALPALAAQPPASLGTLPLEVAGRGLATPVYGSLVTLNAVLVIALELPVTPRVQRLPVRTAVTGGIALIAIGVTAYGVPGIAALYAATLVWALGEILAAPTVAAYPALVASDALRGRYVASATASQSVGYALGPVAGTALWGVAGGAVWNVCAAAGLAAVALSWASVREPRMSTP